ncbi:unnamed protein product [Adineta steineri]|uniref:Uncharacterized protein n=1 Tax=Adineta steineri TaxID=433720 RepID=A0A819H6P2_9BILA|nr:unnamed protein product [Adineta steineri]CAF0984780.1 unnamed protein product [Adineta steineri]CAF1003460.1 unnamed protein product [Adineta steineri]CAF3895081.1 unnamed protein product [Adineta steineri]CAF4010607.1 unnamed protein product [Adineta steineri]
MTTARDFHKSAFILATNSVLLVGGSNGNFDLSSTETFLESNSSFVRQGDTFQIRRFHTVDRLSNYVVVIAGGWSALQTAELYDPLTGISNTMINMTAPRAEHTSAVIDDGSSSTTKVLLVGGQDTAGKLATGDVFDSRTHVFTAVTNNMTSARCYHTATAIGNGYVLLAGGINNASVELDSLELYNSSSNLFVPLSARLSTGRSHHTATYIPSIQAVLFVGGLSQTLALKTYDLFNVSTFTFTILNASTLSARAYHTATLLLDEQVLIVGGEDTYVRVSSCELYRPVTNTFITVNNMSTERADHTSTLLTNTGQVLVCGGENQNNAVLNSCELYQP